MNIYSIKQLEDCKIKAVFFSGKSKIFDVKRLFATHPEYAVLKSDEKLWKSAKLFPHGSGVYFNDDLDLTAEEIWEYGEDAEEDEIELKYRIANIIMESRRKQGISQSKLSQITGISQCDISRIEGGVANPTIETLSRIFFELNIQASFSSKQ